MSSLPDPRHKVIISVDTGYGETIEVIDPSCPGITLLRITERHYSDDGDDSKITYSIATAVLDKHNIKELIAGVIAAMTDKCQ